MGKLGAYRLGGNMKPAYLLQRLHWKHGCDEGTAPGPKRKAFGVLISVLARVKVADNPTVDTKRSKCLAAGMPGGITRPAFHRQIDDIHGQKIHKRRVIRSISVVCFDRRDS